MKLVFCLERPETPQKIIVEVLTSEEKERARATECWGGEAILNRVALREFDMSVKV